MNTKIVTKQMQGKRDKGIQLSTRDWISKCLYNRHGRESPAKQVDNS